MLSVSAHLDYIYAVACVWSNHVVAQVHLTVVSRRTTPSAQVRVGQLGPRRADLQRVRHCPRLLVCMMPQTEPPPHTSSCAREHERCQDEPGTALSGRCQRGFLVGVSIGYFAILRCRSTICSAASPSAQGTRHQECARRHASACWSVRKKPVAYFKFGCIQLYLENGRTV